MKGLPLLVAGLLILPSCEKYTLSRVYRAEVLTNYRNHARDTVQPDLGRPAADTSVYVVAVIVPAGYDWRKDASYGSSGCSVQLWKNNKLQFTTSAGDDTGVGYSPDSHHLCGGHLYTEYCSSVGTTICCDGKELLSYGQREQLKGLLVKDGNIYTVGRSIDGKGFCFRRDGVPLLKQDSGEVFGDFSNPSYGRNGALYENLGAVCFSFRNATSCYIVRDGEMKDVPTVSSAARVRDMRIFGQGVYYVSDYNMSMMVSGPGVSFVLPSGSRWLTASLMPHGDGIWVCADSATGSVCCSIGGQRDRRLDFPGGMNLIYGGLSEFYSLGYDGGDLRISMPGGKVIFSRDSTFLLSASALTLAGDEAFALINPKETDAAPYVWHEGKETRFELNGYLTAIEVEISPPR
jgi:hypothetical protein